MKYSSYHVAFIDTVHPVLWDELSKLGIQCTDLTHLKHEETVALLPQYNGLVIRSKFLINEQLLKDNPQLKFIARSGSGLENIDIAFAQKQNVQIFNSPEGNKVAVAEHIIGMLLAMFNNLKKADQEVRDGIWDREGNRGLELSNKTVGIIGYGVMGKEFAKKLVGFDCEVIAYDKFKSGFSDDFATEVSLSELQKKADVISLHVNYLPDNLHMINKNFWNNCAKNVYFINSSRGKCVYTADLLDAIRNKKVLGACLDVLEQESIAFDNDFKDQMMQELIQNEAILFSPHIAGWTQESYYKLSWYLAQKIKDFIHEG